MQALTKGSVYPKKEVPDWSLSPLQKIIELSITWKSTGITSSLGVFKNLAGPFTCVLAMVGWSWSEAWMVAL